MCQPPRQGMTRADSRCKQGHYGEWVNLISISANTEKDFDMLSVVVDRPHSLAVREMPEPIAAAGEVRVRVRYAGICGSDLHIYRGHNPFVSYPRIIGHEFVGRIESVGDGIEAARVG